MNLGGVAGRQGGGQAGMYAYMHACMHTHIWYLEQFLECNIYYLRISYPSSSFLTDSSCHGIRGCSVLQEASSLYLESEARNWMGLEFPQELMRAELEHNEFITIWYILAILPSWNEEISASVTSFIFWTTQNLSFLTNNGPFKTVLELELA